MVHEAAPRIEFDLSASVTLQCQHWKLFTIDGVRPHVTSGYLPFEIAGHARNVFAAAANLMPSGSYFT
eukprot:10382565-Lingulodinium_polyedra.AAC.1